MTDRFDEMRMKLDPNAVHVYQVAESIDESVFAAYGQDIMSNIDRCAARQLAHGLIESQFIKRHERAPRDMHREFVYQIQIVDPEKADFAKQLDKARAEARHEALSDAAEFIRRRAAAIAGLKPYGSVQALALNGVADTIDQMDRERPSG